MNKPPPEGYQLLAEGDPITKDCLFLSVVSKTWIPIKKAGGKFKPTYHWPIARLTIKKDGEIKPDTEPPAS